MAVSPITVNQFTTDFPEFADTTKFTNASVSYWLNLAANLFDPFRWGDLLIEGIELYVAHNILLEYQAQTSLASGAVPGATTGIIASKSVGGVSKSMDIGSVTVPGAGAWNLTQYGVRYYQLVQMVGIGGLQLGVGAYEGPGYGYLGLFPT